MENTHDHSGLPGPCPALPPRDHHGGRTSAAVRRVWGSEESGKKEKGLPPNSKKESPPKNVVEAKERGKLLATPIVTELSKN